MKRTTLFYIMLAPLLLIGAVVLAIWLIVVRVIDLCGDLRDYLAGRRKVCDKEPAKRRPRRAF